MINRPVVFPDFLISQTLFNSDHQQKITLLHDEFEGRRQELLRQRAETQKKYDQGQLPGYQKGHPSHLESWKVAPIPRDFLDRRVEITGPISNAKMVINMLNENQAGVIASTAMLDFEDSMAPTWENVVTGYQNLIGVARKTLAFFQDGEKEKIYRLNPERMPKPMVRVRGLHMVEKNFLIGGMPVSAGLLDLFTCAYNTAKIFIADGKTPKFYVPKCEHYLEARWWNDLFTRIEELIGLRTGELKVTFLIETLPAAFQMEEILYEIRGRGLGLNGGRWDKIFSDIKTLKMHPDRILADRSTIDMSCPWMDNYVKLLIRTCHEHGAYAMGGMSAFTPGNDEESRNRQVEKVIKDKAREASIGHDGCWVSHPFFIDIAKAQFKNVNQLNVIPYLPENPDLLPQSTGPKTMKGLRQNVRVGIAYQHGWNDGIGCISFENLMEDLATLEISRAQTWQWLHHHITLDDGLKVTPELVSKTFDEEYERILPSFGKQSQKLLVAKEEAKKIFLRNDLSDFFTTI